MQLQASPSALSQKRMHPSPPLPNLLSTPTPQELPQMDGRTKKRSSAKPGVLTVGTSTAHPSTPPPKYPARKQSRANVK